ncbi:e3 ubiquitin-protein ligase HUWE1 [Nephila pilipes]|uniref:E3 ubiquitin-protein ligase TRIP12 n=1 Tax=Nephila pilipes TaxID=299642 RepID=A0A8X6NJP7_NEPPI|nr:e3 ubiquitin-protein ligase HUWE1 [Nephila pilipes]
MKIDRTKLKKSSSEVPPDCKALIEKLKSCNHDELLEELSKIKTWNCGKCELYHWIDALDAFDYILEISCEKTRENQWRLPCDEPRREKQKQLLLCVLQFTALLIEHSFSRHFYNSMEHLTILLSSSDMNVVLAVLNLLYVFSKRSNFITRLNADKRQTLLMRLLYLAESWGGKENGFGLAECCQNLPINLYPASASTLHFEYYAENGDEKTFKKSSNAIIAIHIDNVDKIPGKTPSQIMEELVEKFTVPEDKQMQLFTHIRLAHSFSCYSKRILCVQARLQALSVLVYCNAVPDNVNSLLYNGLIEELVDVLELQDPNLIEIKAAALRTLTSIIHLDRNPKLNAIIDATGAASYHGFLPVLVRNCIQSLTDPESEAFPLPFATALFSFLYHLASYESGGDALVSCGMMEALLKVINWHSTETEHITFVTRAVRVIDLITNLDMQAFQTHGGLASFIQRLEVEVNVCREDQPFVINPKLNEGVAIDTKSLISVSDSQADMEVDSHSPRNRTIDNENVPIGMCEVSVVETIEPVKPPELKKGAQCFPQRAALLKSMLNFLKKSIQDPAFSDNIRHLMDGSLPNSLKHIISNAEYYGPSLFLLGTDVVTVYVFQEPTLLPPLQDNGLTDVVLHALLIKEVPATREVLASLPNVFSALCLNVRGLQSFVACKPFEKLFRVLVSPEYLPAMRRRRSSDPIGDAASNLGNAMDELMRHQPSLRTDATAAIIKLLEELCAMGRDPKFVCSRPATKPDIVTAAVTRIANVSNDAGSSDEEEEEEDDTGSTAVQGPLSKSQNDRGGGLESNGLNSSKTAVPLVDYILNVMRFVDAILSNNSTDDHCREFVRQKGLVPLMAILGLPNLPIDFPVTPTCQAISSVCKSILNLAHEPQVLKQGLLHLNEVLQSLEYLHRPVDPPGGSVLLEELISAPNVSDATLSAQSTPLLHYMSAAHAYIIMFIHVCRTGQSDIRTISISHWGSELGLSVLKGLSSLYTSLVWESTVLLALCSSDSALAEDIQFGRQQLEKLLPKESKVEKEEGGVGSSAELGSSNVTSAMEALSTNSSSAMDIDDGCHCISTDESANGNSGEKFKPKSFSQIKQIKPLLSGASRLGRALAELFGLLVKLCVGSPMRQRRGQQIPPSPSMPSPAARAVATALTRLLAMGLSWEPPPASPVPKFRLTFYICSVGFTSPMLFDERKFPYHLMLQRFVCCGGLDAFFSTFRWALTCGKKVPIEEGLEHPELPDGTGEFLDAWLMLLEKMVNPKTVLESPHTLPFKPNQPGNAGFNPLLFLIHIHKRAFECIMYLWDRRPLLVYGERIAESMLTIICHILKGETIIKEKLTKGDDIKTPTVPVSGSTTVTAAPASSSSRIVNRSRHLLDGDDSSVNQDHLTQLVDMGFSRSLATEALLNTLSLEQATDYLLSYPSSLGRNASTPDTTPALGMDWEMSEEDQMLRAIAMSLGENVLVSTNQVETEPNKTDEQKEQEFVQQKEEPLSSQVLDRFTEKIVEGCLKLADALPETVYRCCDLLIAVSARNGEGWRDRFLINRLLNEIYVKLHFLSRRLKPENIPVERKGWGIGSKLPWIPVESILAVRLHLITLIFEEMKLPVATAVEGQEIIGSFINVLELTASCLNLLQDEGTPKWLPFLVLIIDQYEKAAIMSKRKAPLLMAPKRQWKWFDDRSGKWNNYTLTNNKLIDDAYKAGETSLRFSAGRRNYTVQLTTMVQINEETGNWRPIMLTTENKDEKEKAKPEFKTKEDVVNLDESSDSVSSSDSTAQSIDMTYLCTQPVQMKVIKRLKANQCRSLVRFCVMLMKVPLDPDTLHAVMRLCLRLTRKHCNAVMFAIMEGPKTLLSLTQPYAFIGFTSLTALLFRHILEDPNTLAHTMEKVIRSATAGGSSSLMVSKEMHYIFRVLGPAACRDPDIFSTVASNTLRLTILPITKRDEEDGRYNSNSSVQMLKSVPNKCSSSHSDYAYDVEVASNLIYDLLNALIVKPVELPEEATSSPESNPDTLISTTDQTSPLRETSASDLLPNDDDDGLIIPLTIPNVDGFSDSNESITSPRESRLNKDTSKDGKSDTSSMKNVPIIRKSGICRLLAELVRSYAQCARLIADYSFYADESELLTEDCTALAFILDNLLHNNQTAGDKETPALARVLIAAIASCNHSVEAQTALVNEVRLALLRALSLPESSEKHARIQALTGLISTMIESCPTTSSQNQLGGCALRSQASMNNIVRILLRKGIVVDLARIPHYLDLSSPHMAATVNSALKPLETLSRIVNLPSGHVTGKAKGKGSGATVEIRDAVPEAMEEDASARCSADVSMPFRGNETQAQDMTMDSTLEGLMNEILDRHERSSNSDHQASHDAGNNEQDINISVDMDAHSNTQIGTRRSASFGEHGQDDQQDSSDSESNSESGHSHSEDDAERDERADDAEDEEDDDDDSSRFDVGDDYPGLDFFRVQDRDDSLFFQLEEVFPASSGSSVIFGGTDAVRTFQIPVVTDDSNSGNETPAPTVPPAPRSVTTVHPLLVRHDDSQCSLQPRVHRRQRGYRTNIGGHTWHMYATSNGNNSGRHTNPPVILQSSQPSSSVQSRVVFANSDFRILATEDDVFEIQDQSSNLTGDHSGTLSAIPTTLNRWAEESRVLDGDSIHDCVTGLKPSIIKCLEAHRDDELIERREKRRKLHDKNAEKSNDTIILSDTETLDGMSNATEQADHRTTTMEVAEPASQFESDISAARNIPAVSMPDDMPARVTVPDDELHRLHHLDVDTSNTTASSNWLQPSLSSEQQSPDLSSFCNMTPMDTGDMDGREVSSALLEPPSAFHLISPGFDSESPLTSFSAADIETIDLIDTDTSNEARDIDMFDSSERMGPSSTSDGVLRTALQHTIDLLDSSDEPRSESSFIEATFTDRGLGEVPLRERTLINSSEPDDRLAASSESNSISIINLSDSSDRSVELSDKSSTTIGTCTDDRTSVSAASSCDKTVTEPLSSEITSHLSEEHVITEPDESASQSNSHDTVSHQPRISTPTLISDDAVPCERPTVSESDTPSDFSNVLGAGIEIPEGVDPSFLAALPDNIRQEVIAEQLRLQRLRSRTYTVSNDGNSDGTAFTEVNPEFLAALPPNIQEEVLAQQRAEQQRLAAQNSNPDVPVDPTSFIQTLPQGLRQQVLADMDDSLLALLPPELATEAHSLRRELEARHRQIQERFFSSHAGTTLSRILRSAGRVGARYTIHSLPHRGQWTWNSLSPRGASSPSGNNTGLGSSTMSNSVKLRGRYLLDHEALACLLVLLFVDEPQLNTGRLHRVLRNLCHHGPTRTWVVKSLLSILERTKDYQASENSTDSHRHKRNLKFDPCFPSTSKVSEPASRTPQPSWLSISLDAALGCRTNVFQIRRLTTAHRRANDRHTLGIQSVLQPNVPLVTIHPLASPVICRHVLDTLISLAKSFPVHFLPVTGKDDKAKEGISKPDHKQGKGQSDKTDSKSSGVKSDSSRSESDFWDVLVKLDSLSTTSRKGKSALKTQSVITYGSTANVSSDPDLKLGGFQASALAQLIGLLAHPVVRRSSVLTDRLLRLLALISLALPEPKGKGKSNSDFRHQISEAQLDATDLAASLHSENGQKKITPETKIQTSNLLLEDNEDEKKIMKHYLKLAVEVLTSKTCSEEGLEDATALLLRLSRGCIKTRRTVLFLLLDGARQLGQAVCNNIRALIYELKHLNVQLATEKFSETEDRDSEYDGKFQPKGTIQDRFTNRAVVITAPSKIKSRTGRELQLPSMSSLTSKASSQAFFLRILKVIIQLTESTPLLPKSKITSESDARERSSDANISSTPQPDLSTSNPRSTETTQGLQTFSSLWDLELLSPTSKPKASDVQKDSTSLHLSSQLMLDELWSTLSDCLKELAETPDHHAVLVLQPAVEAFFLVHASSEKESKKKDRRRDAQESEISHLQDLPPVSPLSSLNSYAEQTVVNPVSDFGASSVMSTDTIKFLKFAETHRTVLNQILRQSTTPLADGPFSVLVDHTRVLDFDVKRRYFRQELERMDEGSRREDLAVHVRREHVFEDSFRELHRRTPEEWKNRFYIVFEGEEGQDAGGLLREWYTIISREIFNPMYALFTTSPGDRVTYMINSSSHCNSNHLSYFKFVGRVIAKAVYDNKLLESYFTRSFYKHILGKNVKYTDMESEDYSFYQGLVFLLEHGVNELGYELTFSVEVQEFGVTEIRDLKPNGRNLPVTEENKNEYVKLVCQEKMTGAIRKQLKAFLEGFYEIIPKRLISIFNEQELELLISGLPNIDIDDLKANTEYHKYQPTSLQIQWFWRALRSFDQADRANFLQFVTGTSKVPLQGFAALEGMNGTQKFQIHRDDRSTDRLPSAHTCFNQLDLPAYETYDKLRSMLLKAIHECSEGFGFA